MNPVEQQVRERAYFIWEGEGRIFGRAEQHWLKAEAELRQAADSAPVYVQPVAADLSLAPSPAKTLKPRAPRGASAAAQSVAEKTEAVPRPAKTVTAKTASAKAAPAKAATAKAAAPAKAAATKTATTKTASTKTAAAKTSAAKPRAMAKPRAAAMESGATVH